MTLGGIVELGRLEHVNVTYNNIDDKEQMRDAPWKMPVSKSRPVSGRG